MFNEPESIEALGQFLEGYARGAERRRAALANRPAYESAPGATEHGLSDDNGRTRSLDGRFMRGDVVAAVVAAVDARATSGRYERSGRMQPLYRQALAEWQGNACFWCGRDLGQSVPEVDRLASGAERGICNGLGQCAGGRCRCGYAPGAMVVAHRECHRPEHGESAPTRYRFGSDDLVAAVDVAAPREFVRARANELRTEARRTVAR